MNLFSKLYGATEEVTKALKKPLVESKLKRAYASAIDSAQTQKLEALEKIDQLRADFTKVNLNEILKQKEIVLQAEDTIKAIQEEQTIMFEKEAE